MPDPAKFLFETRFEHGMRPPPPPRSSFTAAEVEAARKAGEQAGHAAGRAKALAEVEARAAAAVDKLAAGMAMALSEIAVRHEVQTRENLATAVEVVRKLFPALAQRHEIGEIEALLADCVARMPDEPRLVVRVPADIAEVVRGRFDDAVARTGFAGRATLIADPALPAGASRIEWSDGSVARDTGALWTEIDSILDRYTAASAS
jgi:flagellar biosynthesis/type III secretory pathway protein FliH